MKTAIFVDVQNIYYTTRDTFRRSFDYKRFWNQIESKDEKMRSNKNFNTRYDLLGLM